MSAPADLAVAKAPTVLIVDDAAASLRLHAAILQRAGYRVLTTESAIDALMLLARETPEVIVLDYMLPVMDAPMFLRQMRGEPRLNDVGVILLTSSSEEAHIEEAFAAGGNDYLTKPVDRRILVARVKSMVDARRDRHNASIASAIVRERDALLREIQEARDLQSAHLPACSLRWDGWSASSAIVPCWHVGGDLVDVISASETERTIALIDVSGHGLAAAMLASSVRSCMRLLADKDLDAMFTVLNQHLCQHEGMYACVALLRVARDHVAIVNAGLPPVAVIENGAVKELIGPTGSPPGLLPVGDYETIRIERRPGVRFALMSDGLTEPFGAADNTAAAVERLRLLTGPIPGGSALAARIGSLFPDGDAQPDDATLVVLSDERAPN